MTGKVLVPPARTSIGDEPSIFLGGSITGAPDWQAEAIRRLRAVGFSGWIFNPRREKAFSEEPGIWEEQVDWERENLKKATVILFWLPAGADALTSRWEMAEFARAGKQLVVGIAEGVARKKYMEYVLINEYRENAMICNSLGEVCWWASSLAQKLFATESIPGSSDLPEGELQRLLDIAQKDDWDLEQGPDDSEMW